MSVRCTSPARAVEAQCKSESRVPHLALLLLSFNLNSRRLYSTGYVDDLFTQNSMGAAQSLPWPSPVHIFAKAPVQTFPKRGERQEESGNHAFVPTEHASIASYFQPYPLQLAPI